MTWKLVVAQPDCLLAEFVFQPGGFDYGLGRAEFHRVVLVLLRHSVPQRIKLKPKLDSAYFLFRFGAFEHGKNSFRRHLGKTNRPAGAGRLKAADYCFFAPKEPW